jgi:hypothetical protein
MQPNSFYRLAFANPRFPPRGTDSSPAWNTRTRTGFLRAFLVPFRLTIRQSIVRQRVSLMRLCKTISFCKFIRWFATQFRGTWLGEGEGGLAVGAAWPCPGQSNDGEAGLQARHTGFRSLTICHGRDSRILATEDAYPNRGCVSKKTTALRQHSIVGFHPWGGQVDRPMAQPFGRSRWATFSVGQSRVTNDSVVSLFQTFCAVYPYGIS